MYTTQKNVQILLSLLKQYNIRHIVISPGSRNIPLVKSVEGDPFFTTYSVVDERSAAYFAIGVSLEVGQPVVISSTSAQATRNYIPGMTEAYYRGAQLVVITSDYRPSIIGQGVMQAVDQLSIPRDSAKISVALPMVHDAADHRHCVRLVNQALLELSHHGTGPVHINVPTEEHWTGGIAELPVAPKINRHTAIDTLPDIGNRKVLVAIGQHQPFTPQQQKALDDFSTKYNVVVYTNHLSNYSGPRSVEANLFLEGQDAKIFQSYSPDILITIGGQPGDYAFDGRIKSAISPYQHWRVHQDGVLQDTYGRLTDVFEMSDQDFFKAYANKTESKNGAKSYYEQWQALTQKRHLPSELPLSHAMLAQALLPKIPPQSVIHFAILSSLRNWNYFKSSGHFISYSNVAAFGIDGCMSTFIGQSVATDKLCFFIVGDLSFFYDMNILGNRHIKNNARIVLINNNGGGEFRLYSHSANEFGDEANKHIAAGGHNGSAKAWAESRGWHYLPVHTKDDLQPAVEALVSNADSPVFVEIFTTMADDSDGVKLIVAANAHKSLKSRLLATLSPEAKRRIKRVLKK